MRFLLNPDDALGRHQNLCLFLLAIAIIIGGSL